MEITHGNLYESPDCDEGGQMVTVQDLFEYVDICLGQWQLHWNRVSYKNMEWGELFLR